MPGNGCPGFMMPQFNPAIVPTVLGWADCSLYMMIGAALSETVVVVRPSWRSHKYSAWTIPAVPAGFSQTALERSTNYMIRQFRPSLYDAMCNMVASWFVLQHYSKAYSADLNVVCNDVGIKRSVGVDTEISVLWRHWTRKLKALAS